jgi:hypothetical protein
MNIYDDKIIFEGNATFIGSDGSMGLSRNKTYFIKIICIDRRNIYVKIDNIHFSCLYSSLKAVMCNWDLIDSVEHILDRANEQRIYELAKEEILNKIKSSNGIKEFKIIDLNYHMSQISIIIDRGEANSEALEELSDNKGEDDTVYYTYNY